MTLRTDLTNRKYRPTHPAKEAELACRLAKQFEKAGDYEAAYEALAVFWPDRHELPNLVGLPDSVRAEMLQRVGALAGWLGGTDPVNGSQERAKDLITKSIEIFG